MNSEDAISTFFAGLQSLKPPFVTVSRRLRLVEELAPEEFPALFQNQMTFAPHSKTLMGSTAWTVDLELYVYALAPDPAAASTPTLNPLIDAVLTLFGDAVNNSGNFTTADGTTCSVCVTGSIPMFEGLLGERAVARIPVQILIPRN